MELSVAYTFDRALIPQFARFPEVKEIFCKLDRDVIGGGRATYTLRPASRRVLVDSVGLAHRHGIAVNYLLNGATLGGLEQTRAGQRAIRRQLDWLDGIGVDAVTVASPYLLRVVKTCHPRLRVRVGVFAMIDNASKARLWEDMGADTLCISAIACNRDFKRLVQIRSAVQCTLQLIVNASCRPYCHYELTHMNLLTVSSQKGNNLRGFCLDYCFLDCSSKKIREPVNFIRSTWIRPEDLTRYEALGYHSFKIVERSCPSDLLIKRVQAYCARSFSGNLLEIVGTVAQIKKQQQASLKQRLRMIALLGRPLAIKISSMLVFKKYAEKIILHDFGEASAPVYIDNGALDGFLDGIQSRDCAALDCRTCGYCLSWAQKTVRIDSAYRAEAVQQAEQLDNGLHDGSLWN
ncbi:MAG: U32 family peptidase [Chitinivibrionales bacterium]|nr:U32 family peptidase [Chitinivibrionales bacterium]